MPRMATSPSQTETGHESPFVRNFNLFLPNRVGRLSELLDLMGGQAVEIAGLSVIDSTDWAVVRMVFTEPDKAREVLSRNGVAFTESEVLGIVLSDPDSLSRATKALLAAELNVQFAYPLLVRHEGMPIMVVHVEDTVLAAQILAKHGFVLMDLKGR